jgi:Ca2+-binding RTX toxin-like protein
MSTRALVIALGSAAVATAALVISVGGAARPTPTCAGETATILGTRGPDRIVGTPGNDVIVGLDGADRIHGAGGRDVVCGGGGDDHLDGGEGVDRLYGGPGDDRLTGGPGGVMGAFHRTEWETLVGGAGRDDLDVRDLYPNPSPSTPAEDRCFREDHPVACPTFHPGWVVE